MAKLSWAQNDKMGKMAKRVGGTIVEWGNCKTASGSKMKNGKIGQLIGEFTDRAIIQGINESIDAEINWSIHHSLERGLIEINQSVHRRSSVKRISSVVSRKCRSRL